MKVTLCPNFDKGALDVTVVVVEAALTVTRTRCDRLPLKVPSPV